MHHLRVLRQFRLHLPPISGHNLRAIHNTNSAADFQHHEVTAEQPIVPRKRRSRQPKPPNADINVAEDVRRHYCTPELDAIMRSFPEKYLRKKYRYPDTFYIADPQGAAQLEQLLFADQPANDRRPIVEVNPGPGLLTQRLFDSGRVRDLRLYEANREFVPALQERFVNAGDDAAVRCDLRHGDMLSLYRMSYQDKMDKGDRVERFLADLPQRDWSDDTNMRLFACVGSVNFFKHLISSTVLQNDLMAFGRPELLLVMPPPLYIHLTCDNRAGLLLYRATTVLFQIFFTHEFVARVPRKYFLPYQFKTNRERYSRIQDTLDFDREHLYLVRIEPRRDLFTDIVAPDQIQALWYFVRQNCISRTTCVIPNLEKLIPNAGAHLILDQSGPPQPVRPLPGIRIAADAPNSTNPCTTMSRNDRFSPMNIFTTFGDLSPAQMLALFHQFCSWPGYENSAFLQGLEDCLQKMEISSAGIEDVLVEESAPADDAMKVVATPPIE